MLNELRTFFDHKHSNTNVVVAMLCGLAAAVLAQESLASTIAGINHTHWAINHFNVDGRSAIDIIGPYQGGGEAAATSRRRAGNRV